MTMLNKYELMAMAAGFLLGGIISSIITEKVVEKRMNEEINKELDKLRVQKVVRLNAKDKDAEEISKNISKTSYIEVSKFSESSIDDHDIDTHGTQYNEEFVKKEDDYVSKYGTYDDPIHAVTFEETCDAPEGWKCIWFKWYAQDDVLTDEDDDPVDFSLIGNFTDDFDEYVFDTDEPDTIYVSNRNTMTIYEVQRLDENYYESVLGGMKEWDDINIASREKIPKRKDRRDD